MTQKQFYQLNETERRSYIISQYNGSPRKGFLDEEPELTPEMLLRQGMKKHDEIINHYR